MRSLNHQKRRPTFDNNDNRRFSKRVKRDPPQNSNPFKIEEETGDPNAPPPLVQNSSSFDPNNYRLGKRGMEKRQKAPDPISEEETDPARKFKLGKPARFDFSSGSDSGLELDEEKMEEFKESQKNRKIPAIKFSLRIFETLPKTFYKTYDCLKEIGRGAYGTVYKGINNVTGEYVAIKKIFLRDKMDDFNELNILKEANHPHMITPIEYCVFEKHLYIVSKYCEGGSLFQRLIKKKSLSEETCRHIIFSMLGALNYCHNVKKIVHRDIKPENMVFEDDSEDNIKLIDFGLSAFFKQEQYLDKKCGSAFYLAPEILKGSYNQKVDIWSLGVVLFVLVSGRPLVYGKDQTHVLSKLYSLKSVASLVRAVLKGQSPELVDFILKMLRVDPSERWGAKELLGHEWLAQSVSQSQGKSSQEKLHQTMSMGFWGLLLPL